MILETIFNNVELISANHLGMELLRPSTYKGINEDLANILGLAIQRYGLIYYNSTNITIFYN